MSVPSVDSSQHAYTNGMAATRALSKSEQKALGQYMTPPAIARFMARRAVQGLSSSAVRILEPAAGSGVLAVAAVEALSELSDFPKRIELLLFEVDRRLIDGLQQVCEALRDKCTRRGISLDFHIAQEDFLLSTIALQREPLVDLVICNPPYFKISGQDERAVAHADVVWGQPNIYGLFLGVCADLVRSGGRYCFITPRSWMSGPYFAKVRQRLLSCLQLDALHVFDSRRDHFSEEELLQEAVIVWGTARRQEGLVCVSSSRGWGDLEDSVVKQLAISELVSASDDKVIRLPAGAINGATPRLDHSFASHGLKVSTGPVLAFRASTHLRRDSDMNSVPLLWLQHVKAMSVDWPIQKKHEHIAVSADNAWMLLRNEPMVILRRFSPKEDDRRVKAAPYFGNLRGAFIGIENHLNYVSRPGGRMSISETLGLAAFLNSRLVSDYFESISGHTQVNATDLRTLPLPSVAQLERIGELVVSARSVTAADQAVAEVLRVRQFPSVP